MSGPATVLFVCTGNICRSPMAEAIARAAVASAAGIDAEELAATGGRFASAGTYAVPGNRATAHAVAATAEIGIDLSGHHATPLTAGVIQSADRVYVMELEHLREVEELAPGHDVDLLRPDGRPVDDPYGASLRHYRKTRDEIQAAVEERLPELLEAFSL